MNELLNLKIDRCFWISLLEQDKIIEAVSSFNSNIVNLNNMMKMREFKNLSNDIEDEIKKCQDIFCSILFKKSNEYMEKVDYPKALEAFTFLIRVNSEDYNIIKNYIKCLVEFKQNDLVEIFSEKLILFNENISDTHKFLAEMFSKIENSEKACFHFEKYMYLKTGENKIAEDYNLLGCYYHKLYTDTYNKEAVLKAIENFIKAYEIEPTSKVYLKNITIVLPLINDYATSKKYWEEIFKMNNITYDDQYDYAALCLKTKDFDGWHKYFDGRLKKETNRGYFPEINKPMWDEKKDITNKTLLVYCEQGFGDTILMSLFVPQLLNYTKNVIFVV